MDEEIIVKRWVIIEAARALRAIRNDPNSYYAKVFSDDAANIREAGDELERLLMNAGKQGE
jgi:hypothetical protein